MLEQCLKKGPSRREGAGLEEPGKGGGRGVVAEVVGRLGEALQAPHMDPQRVEEFFGERHGYPEAERLGQIAREGVPLSSVGPGGDLDKELEYGNHRSADMEGGVVWEKLVQDVASGKALVLPRSSARSIPGLRVSPVGVVTEKGDKKRQIHDLTIEVGDGKAVNATTAFEEVPECTMATVLGSLIQRFVGLRTQFPTAHIVWQKSDLKSAFRQVPVSPGGAQAFAYVFGEFLVVDLRLQFGWRGSPGWFGLVAGAIEHAQCNTPVEEAVFTPSGLRAVEHVRVEPPTGRPVMPVPPHCVAPRIETGGGRQRPFTRFYVDDAMSLEVCGEGGVDKCLTLTRSLASIHHILLGERGEGEEPVLSRKKITNWAPQMEILGYWVDAEAGTIGLPERKLEEIRSMLEGWPYDRKVATVGEVLSLAGKLHHAAFVIRPSRYYVRRLLQLTNLHLSGSEAAGKGEAWGAQRRAREKGRRLVLTPEFMADVGWWKWFLGREGGVRGERVTSPAFSFVEQLPTRRWFADASLQVVGGLCSVKRVYWRWELPGEVTKRTVKHNRKMAGDAISINLLEVVAAVMTAQVMIRGRGDRPEREGEAALIRTDNTSTVSCVVKCRSGGKGQERAGALMRMLGALEVEGGFGFQAKHIPGVENRLADGITRWPAEEVYTNLMRESPGAPWQVYEIKGELRRTFTEILREASCLGELQRRLARLIAGLGGVGEHGERK